MGTHCGISSPLFVIAWLALGASQATVSAEAVPVQIQSDGTWTRAGKPYFIKGAGGGGSMAELARRGGNSVRTWGDAELGGSGGTLARAEKHGLTVCAGIWLESECGWFSYKNSAHCQKQLERVKKVIHQHKDHPALLCWGLGNEAEGAGDRPEFWQQINALAKATREIDPHHPTFTAVAGFGEEKIKTALAHAPDLSFVGINTYAALRGLREALHKFGWHRPWVVTEYGARGFWESPRTAWKTPIEQTSTAKAAQLKELYPLAIGPRHGCGGGYVFLWGWKQEATGTWFSLFSQENESTGSVDVLEELWTGKVPSNQAPRLEAMEPSRKDLALKPGQTFRLKARAVDPDAADADRLTYSWAVRPEAKNSDNSGRDPEPLSDLNAISLNQGSEIEVTAPQTLGSWRVFLQVRDGHGHLATGNVPFSVEGGVSAQPK